MDELTKTCSSLNGGMVATDRKTRRQYTGIIPRSVKPGDESIMLSGLIDSNAK